MQNPPRLLTEAPGSVTETGHGRVPELEATPGRGEGSALRQHGLHSRPGMSGLKAIPKGPWGHPRREPQSSTQMPGGDMGLPWTQAFLFSP